MTVKFANTTPAQRLPQKGVVEKEPVRRDLHHLQAAFSSLFVHLLLVSNGIELCGITYITAIRKIILASKIWIARIHVLAIAEIEQNDFPGTRDPGFFPKYPRPVGKVPEEHAGDDHIELSIFCRNVGAVALSQLESPLSAFGRQSAQHSRAHVASDDPITKVMQRNRYQPGATAKVQDARARICIALHITDVKITAQQLEELRRPDGGRVVSVGVLSGRPAPVLNSEIPLESGSRVLFPAAETNLLRPNWRTMKLGKAGSHPPPNHLL